MPEKVSARMAPAPEPRHGRPILRMLVTSVLLVSIAYVAVYLAIGTEGFRSYAAEYLGDRLGLPVRIRSSKATPSLNLVLGGVTVRSTDEVSRAECRIAELRVDWRLAGRDGGWLERAVMKDCVLTMAQRAHGGWEPGFASRLGDWLSQQCGLKIVKPGSGGGAAQPPKDEAKQPVSDRRLELDPGRWKGGVFSLSDGKIVWLNSAGVEMAVVEGVTLDITPLRVPHRKLVHYRASIARGRFEDKRQVYDLVYESLRTGKDEIVLAFTGQWATGPVVEEGAGADE